MEGTIHAVIGFPGGVELANAADSYYSCTFETPEELQSFIEELRVAGEVAFNSETQAVEIPPEELLG